MEKFRVEIFYDNKWHIFEEHASSHLQAKDFAIRHALHEIYGKSWQAIRGKFLDLQAIRVYRIKGNRMQLFYSFENFLFQHNIKNNWRKKNE